MNLRRWIKDRSLFVKLLLLGLALSLPLLVLVGALIAAQVRGVLETQAGNRLQELAFQTADKLDRNLFERYGDVQVFALSSPAKSMLSASITVWMNQLVQAYSPMYSLMVVADGSGQIIAVNTLDGRGNPLESSRVEALIGRNVAGESWFQRSMSGSILSGLSHVENLRRDPLLEAVLGPERALSLSFSAPILDPDGRPVGVWSNRFDWAAAQGILREAERRAQDLGQKTLHLSMFSAQGVLLDHPNPARILGGKDTVHAASRANIAVERGSALGLSFANPSVPALEGWSRSQGYSSYPGLNWTVAASQDRAEVGAEVGRLTLLVVGLLLLLLLSSVLASWLVSRYVVRRVRRMVGAAHTLAQGDLEPGTLDDAKDEIGTLSGAFGGMIAHQRRMAEAAAAIGAGQLEHTLEPASERDTLGLAFVQMQGELRGLVGELRRGSEGLRGASSGLLAQASGQAAGVSQQSAAIAETTATIEQVKASADQASEMAQTVSLNASSASRTAQAGVEAVREAEGGMEEIKSRVGTIAENILSLSEQTQQIDHIISSVSDLADQSNLLALNAAIEAARAGEQGRGFSVVAQEIRLLAERSKAATAQVRSILSDIQKATNLAVMSTEQGLKVAEAGEVSIGRVGRTLDDLNEAVNQAAYSAQLIAASVRQHSIGMEQVAVAMTDINTAVAGNQRSSQQTREAAEELSLLAGKLSDLVARYRV